MDSGLVKEQSALDLGCGIGRKSIYLAKCGFNEVTGIDISTTAIKIARENAKDKKVSNTNFIVGDVTNLSFLNEKRFDFVLDWVMFHCLAEEKMKEYVAEVAKHTKKNGLLMLRVFSNYGTSKNYFIEEVNGRKSKVMLLSQEKI